VLSFQSFDLVEDTHLYRSAFLV